MSGGRWIDDQMTLHEAGLLRGGRKSPHPRTWLSFFFLSTDSFFF